MPRTKILLTLFIIFPGLFSLLTGCSINESRQDMSMDMYEVHQDGRIYSFYDQSLYKEFLQLGETPYRLTRIGAGPKGETIVFGLTKHDKKMKHDIPAISIFDGKNKAPKNFYAEMRKHGRIYVFDRYEDMNTVRQFGHPNYFYTQIGAGPNGETVVYVLNKHNKNHRPEMLLKTFAEMNKS